MFNWEDYYSLAAELCSPPPGPAPSLKAARLRTAISRAYYAAYNKARNKYLPNWIPADGEGSHEQTFRELRNTKDSNAALCAHLLKSLKRDRADADYLDLIPMLDQVAKNALLSSQSILKLC